MIPATTATLTPPSASAALPSSMSLAATSPWPMRTPPSSSCSTAKSSTTPHSAPPSSRPATATPPAPTPKPSSTPTSNTAPNASSASVACSLLLSGIRIPVSSSVPAIASVRSPSTTTGMDTPSPSPAKSKPSSNTPPFLPNSTSRSFPNISHLDMSATTAPSSAASASSCPAITSPSTYPPRLLMPTSPNTGTSPIPNPKSVPTPLGSPTAATASSKPSACAS